MCWNMPSSLGNVKTLVWNNPQDIGPDAQLHWDQCRKDWGVREPIIAAWFTGTAPEGAALKCPMYLYCQGDLIAAENLKCNLTPFQCSPLHHVGAYYMALGLGCQLYTIYNLPQVGLYSTPRDGRAGGLVRRQFGLWCIIPFPIIRWPSRLRNQYLLVPLVVT